MDVDVVSVKQLSIRQNLIWNTVGNLLYLVVQWALTYCVIIFLGYGEAGVFSLAMSIGNSFYNIATFTIRNYQVSDVSNRFSDDTYILARRICSVAAVLLCILFTVWNGYSLATMLCILMYMLFKISEAMADVYHGIMQRALRMDCIGISFAMKGIVELIFFVVAIILGKTLFIALLCLTVASFGLVYFFDRRIAFSLSVPSDPSRKTQSQVRQLLKTCIPIALYGFFFNTMAQIPRFFLESLSGAEILGVYTSVALPVTIVQVSANFIFSPVTTPLANCIKVGNIKQFIHYIKLVFAGIAIVGIISLPSSIIFGRSFLSILYGSSIVSHDYLLFPLVISGLLVAASWFIANTLTVLRQLRILLLASCISFFIVVISSVPLILACGQNGVTFSFILGLLIFFVICLTSLVFEVRNKMQRQCCNN
ncbi:polysaccharide biosynthesis protein [Coriobacterium glomerans PW2]|uniref:Polysaccharide biosynthesis protein n=1 Tax=Coriobacterium glomerans (strain ATCC 49209 / DSM 20642 / JCM 10262 / PW2) TaxID=700015 RepID=F2N846_CORGP|nr:oligosaccharide flippase family protein [Coriobacterium glomerans]AEB07229.1 polysaccharide biosynthesis protein [Coriobacterium glomerans PW2]